ncbi:tyrosine N-monooxygenase-like [Panicum miliaceum]|uniref:Tyrosine N-monooxygenase-like n=1 Tax=Panicum miliaceum TaxID=4540 RepID=A0A3L6RW92_PANMI|nr:tyrosine N-monooxygenase-like [Panicum miliaceum]
MSTELLRVGRGSRRAHLSVLLENFSNPNRAKINMAMEAAAAASSPPLGASLPSSSTVLKALLLMVMLVYLAQTIVSRRKSTCTAPLPPGPTPWPVVGNLPEMLLSDMPAFRWIHLVMEKTGTDIACVKLGGVHVIPVTGPDIAREVLKRQDANFASRPLTLASRTFSRGYTDAAMSPYGEQWRKMRRVLTSEIVCPSRHKWLHDKRADEADNLTRYVYNLAGAGSGGAVDVRHVARHYCGNVVRRLVFGRRYFGEPRPDGGPGPLEVQHVDAVFASLGLLYSFRVSDYLPWLLGLALDLDGHEKMVREANEKVTRLHDKFIDERWRQWKSGERQELEDLLDVLITLEDAEAKPVLTIEEVKAQSQDIMFAAMDNPSNAVEWALAEMVNGPEMLKKAVEEIDGVVGRDRQVQESDIPRLSYLKACIREAFRLHPVAPFNVPHVALADATVAGYHIPKGSHVILSRIGLGRNPAFWADPLRFNPDRHIPADPTADVTLAENDLRFISFSTGRRGCIAASLGTAMSVMLFGRLMHGFSWSKPAGMVAVDLSESRHDIFMAKPLVLHAEPRLPAHLYSAT